jgi:hypothetical protein
MFEKRRCDAGQDMERGSEEAPEPREGRLARQKKQQRDARSMKAI